MFPRLSITVTLENAPNISRCRLIHPSQSPSIADSATGARISAATLQRTLILTSRATIVGPRLWTLCSLNVPQRREQLARSVCVQHSSGPTAIRS